MQGVPSRIVVVVVAVVVIVITAAAVVIVVRGTGESIGGGVFGWRGGKPE